MRKNKVESQATIRMKPITAFEISYLMDKYGLNRHALIIRLIAQAYAVEKEREKMK